MENKSRLFSILLSLPFWWILVTAVYVPLTIFGRGYIIKYFWSWFGMFVPIGIFNFYAAFDAPFTFEVIGGAQPWRIIAIPVVLLTVFGGEWFLRKWNVSPVAKFLLILIILFILTAIVDLIIWGNWESLEILKRGKINFLL